MKTRIANEMENQENNKQAAVKQQQQFARNRRPAANLNPKSSKLASRSNNKQAANTIGAGLIEQSPSLQSEWPTTRPTNRQLNTHQPSSQPQMSSQSSPKAQALPRERQQQPPQQQVAPRGGGGGSGNGALMRRPYVRFDDYLDLNEENMRRSCKRLMNHLYSAESASAQTPASAPRAQHSAPASVMSCKVAPRWPTGAPPPPSRHPIKLEASSAYPKTAACSSGLLVVAPGVATSSGGGKSYLRSQYELRQLRQLEMMSKMNQKPQLPEAPMESASASGGAGATAARQESGSQHQHPSLHQHHQQLQQQDLVARSHELSKQRFFERLERRKSMNISDGAADATCGRITGSQAHKSSLNQMSAARQQMEANNSAASCNRQKGLGKLKGHPRHQTQEQQQLMLGPALDADDAAIVPCQPHQGARLNGSSHPIIDECHESHGSISGLPLMPASVSPNPPGNTCDTSYPSKDSSIDASIAKSNKQQQQVAGGTTSPAAQLIAFYSSTTNDVEDANNQLAGVSCQQLQQLSPVTRAQPEQVYQFIPALSSVTKVSETAADTASTAKVQCQDSNDEQSAPLFSDAELLVLLEPSESATEAGQQTNQRASKLEIYNYSYGQSPGTGDNKMMQPLNQTQSSARTARSTHMRESYLIQVEEPSLEAETMEARGKLEEQVTELQLMHSSAPPPAQQQRKEAAVSLTISSENDAVGQLPADGNCELIKATHQWQTTGCRADSKQPSDGQSEAAGTNCSILSPVPETVISQLVAVTADADAVTSEEPSCAKDTLANQQLPLEAANRAQQVPVCELHELQTTTITNTATASNEINSAISREPMLNVNPQLELAFSQVNETDQGPYANSVEPDLAASVPPLMLDAMLDAPQRPKGDNGAHHETGSRANESAPCHHHDHENIVLLEEEETLIESSYAGPGTKLPVGKQQSRSSSSSLVDDDEATSSCGSSGFGASVSVTSSASGKLNLKRASSTTVPTSSSSSCSPVDECQARAETCRSSEQVLELYCANNRWHEDELFGYKRLVGPDQSYPLAVQTHQQHPCTTDNHHNYATVAGGCDKLTSANDQHHDHHEPPATGNIYVNLPRAAEYGSYLSANKMQHRDKLSDAEATTDNNRNRFSASPSLQSYSTTNSSASGGFSTLAPVAGQQQTPGSTVSSSNDIVDLHNESLTNNNSRKSKSSLLRRFGCLVSRAFTGGPGAGASSTSYLLDAKGDPPTQVKSNKPPLDQVIENNSPTRATRSEAHQQHSLDGPCVYGSSLKQQDLVILPTKHVNQPAPHNHQEAAHTICRIDDRLSRGGREPLSSNRSISASRNLDIKLNTLESPEALSNSLSFNSSSFDGAEKKSPTNEPPSTRIGEEEDYGYHKKSGGRKCCSNRKISNHETQQHLRGCIEIDCVKPAGVGLQSAKQRSLLRLFTVTSSGSGTTPAATCGAMSTPDLGSASKNRDRKAPLVDQHNANPQKTSGFWGFSSLMLAGSDLAAPPDAKSSRKSKQKSPNDSPEGIENRLHLLPAQHHSLGVYQSLVHNHTTKRRPHHHHHHQHRRYHQPHHHHHHHHQRHSGALEASNCHFRSLQLTSVARQHQHRRGSTKRSSKGYCSGGECSLDDGFRAFVAGQLVKINKSDGSQLIELKRTPGKPWGFFVARGSIDSTKGIFISRMHDEATSSALAGLLNIGDRILAIDECKIEPDCDILRVNQMISKKSKILLKVKPFKG